MNKTAGMVIGGLVLVVIGFVAGWQVMNSNGGMDLGEVIDNAIDKSATTEEVSKPAPGGATKPATGTSVKPKTVTVRYTETGFQPFLQEVEAGQVVTFVNESNKTLFVKSTDIRHPYVSLNQGTSIGKGKTWTFTFTQSGTYGFHNDNFKDHKGAIAVMPQN